MYFFLVFHCRNGIETGKIRVVENGVDHSNENYLFDEQRKEIFVGGFVVKVLQIR